jgi:hypothetical protein
MSNCSTGGLSRRAELRAVSCLTDTWRLKNPQGNDNVQNNIHTCYVPS